MHEYSLVQALLERVDLEVRRRQATAVHRVRVRIGELAGVEVPLLRTAFTMARGGSTCADAELELVPIAARWHCTRCEIDIERGMSLRCPRCDRPAALVEGGDLFLESVEMEVA